MPVIFYAFPRVFSKKRLLCFNLEGIFNPIYCASPHSKYAFLFCFCLRPTEAHLLISPYNGNEEVT